MKTTKFILAIACVLGLAASTFAQSLQTRKNPGTLGYLDPKTGAFRTLPTADISPEPQSLTIATGKIVTTFTITVSSAIAASAKISCAVQAAILDATTGAILEDIATVIASRSGTSTATCTVTLPYSWNLGSASSDMVALGYEIYAPAEGNPTAAASFPNRDSLGFIANLKVPADGTTTNETVTATF
jgi:hypothetical protein